MGGGQAFMDTAYQGASWERPIPHSNTSKLHSSLSLHITKVLLPGKVFEGKNGYMGNRAKLQYLLMIFQFLECKIYWCKTEIAPGRINFVMEVFISYQQFKEEKQTFGAGSGMCSELLNSTRLLTEIVTSRPHSLFMEGEGLSLSPLPVALVCFPAIWTEGASLKTWSLQSGLSSGTGSIIVPKTNIDEPESLRISFSMQIIDFFFFFSSLFSWEEIPSVHWLWFFPVSLSVVILL